MAESWHLDKKVPISLLASQLLLIGSIFYWGGNMDTRVAALETQSSQCRAAHQEYENREDELSELAAEISVHIEYMAEDIKEIKEALKDHSLGDK